MAALLALILALPIVAASPAGAAGDVVVLADSFSRSLSGGWGTADIGGSYGHLGQPDALSVDGSVGEIRLPKSGAQRVALAQSVAVQDSDTLVRVRIDSLAAGGQWLYGVARHNGNDEYRPKLFVQGDGRVYVHAGYAIDNRESAVAPRVEVSGLTASPGDWLWLRSRVTGTEPTTIKVKAWADGSTEPDEWQFNATNNEAALQGPGSVGVRAYVGTTASTPHTLAVDDLEVRSLDEPVPQPPTADFDWAQQADSLTVDFSDLSTGAVTGWSWDFGDGTGSTEANPSHTYASDGSYDVTLEVSGPDGSDSHVAQVDVEPLPPPPPPSTTLARDEFERERSGSWGAADKGGLYSYISRLSDYSTDGSGVLRLPNAGVTRGTYLLSTLALDVDVTFTVSTDKAIAGGPLYIYAALRRTVDGLAYQPKIRIAPNGNVFAHAGKVGSNGESSLAPEVRIDGLTHTAGTPIHVRAQAIGNNPTTIRVRAWADGTPEPSAWAFSVNDGSVNLQGPGSVGLLAYIASSASNTPLNVAFDDLLVTTEEPLHRASGPTLVGAGDVASCNSVGDEQTAALLDDIDGTVFVAGDVAYPSGSAVDFANCYGPSWGRHLARTRPAIGNHEYNASSVAAPYFDYFGSAAGEAGKGWYAYDLGSWRIYVLNSNCGFVGCGAGSEQLTWLQADLAANPRQCSLAIWHHPRFSSGSEHGSTTAVQPFWQALADAGADVVLSGHDHGYERFAPLDASGVQDPDGLREFVVGTGGAGFGPGFGTPLAASQVRQRSTFGVLQLTLGDGEYEWQFVSIAGQLWTDRGSDSCH